VYFDIIAPFINVHTYLLTYYVCVYVVSRISNMMFYNR